MENLNDILYGAERDQVTRASASTYNLVQLQQLGLKITVNTSSQKTRWVGGDNNRIYPQIIIWRPDSPESTTGSAVIVETIETMGTLIGPNVDTWRRLASTGGVVFNLVIPADSLERVRTLLRENNIAANVTLQTYTYNPAENRYFFTTQP